MAKVAADSVMTADSTGFPAHDVIGFILDHERELSRSHRKIARAIVTHPTTFVEKPIEDLVTWLEVSAPTITRFSRTIGCDGLINRLLGLAESVNVCRFDT